MGNICPSTPKHVKNYFYILLKHFRCMGVIGNLESICYENNYVIIELVELTFNSPVISKQCTILIRKQRMYSHN